MPIWSHDSLPPQYSSCIQKPLNKNEGAGHETSTKLHTIPHACPNLFSSCSFKESTCRTQALRHKYNTTRRNETNMEQSIHLHVNDRVQPSNLLHQSLLFSRSLVSSLQCSFTNKHQWIFMQVGRYSSGEEECWGGRKVNEWCILSKHSRAPALCVCIRVRQKTWIKTEWEEEGQRKTH